jgi:hypothetical protein
MTNVPGHGGANSIVAALMHLLGTAIVFGAILLLAWCISFLIGWLHAMHPFPPEAYRFLSGAKLWLVYFDVTVTAVLVVVGAVRFIERTWEAK